MKSIKRAMVLFLACGLLLSWNSSSYASDNTFRDTFESSFYAGLLGALVGGALLAFTNNPNDHLDYIVYGGAGGVLLGAGYGVIKSTKSLAEYDNGKIKFAVPTIIPELRESVATGQTSLAFNAQLIRGKF